MSGQFYRRGKDGWFAPNPEIISTEQGRAQAIAQAVVDGQGDVAQLQGILEQTGGRRDFNTLGTDRNGATFLGGGFGLLARSGPDGYQEIGLDAQANITAIDSDEQGSVYAHGWRQGEFILYRGDFSTGFDVEATTRDMGSAYTSALLNGTLFIGGTRGLFRYRDGVFSNVSLPTHQAVIALAKASEDILWIVLEKDVLRWDGKNFQLLEQPASE